MNESNHLPEKYNAQKSMIKDKFLQNLYSYFIFQCIIFNEDTNKIDNSIYNFLNENRFFTYQFSTKSNKNRIQNNVVFCYERTCLILEHINKEIVLQKINETSSSFLDVNVSQNDNLEITGFYETYICQELENNHFIKYTIGTLISYIIRRNYYPSNFFKDQNFFSFNQKIQFKRNNFINLRSIGSSSTPLSMSLYKPTLQVFVIKYFSNKEQYKRELDFYNNNSHQVFTPCYGFIEDENAIVYKFMSNGSLYSYYSNNENAISKLFPYNAMSRISQGIGYLHTRNLIHRDLQPANILIDNDLKVYISDFETVRSVNLPDNENEEFTQDIGSIRYESPEQHSNKVISVKTDIYSFGLIMYFLFEKKDMFDGINICDINNRKKKNLILEIQNENANDKIKNLCKSCLNSNADERPTIQSIQKTIALETERDILIRDIGFYLTDINEVIEYTTNCRFLSELTQITHNNKYFWIFSLFYLYLQINSPNFFLFLGYYFLYIDEIRKVDHIDKKEKEKNIKKALQYFEKAAEVKNSEALVQLGNIYYYGKYVTRDENLAKSKYEKAADLNNSDSLIQLGEWYFNEKFEQKDDSKAIKYYELAASKYNPNALLKLGNLYYEGIKVKQDYSKALKYFQDASILHNSDALIQLGNLYYYGHGVKKNYFKAKEYYEMAVNLNNNTACLKLGNMYNDGKGVDVDISKSIKYYVLSYRLRWETNLTIFDNTSSNRSYTISCNNLGLIYVLEEKYLNNDLASCFLSKSANEEYSFGQNNFALYEELILELKVDFEYFYLKSSKQNFALAFFNLGRMKEMQENKIDDSIEFYIQASDNENKPLVFKQQEIHDERFELSKTYIICLTNLRLTHYFLIKEQNEHTDSNHENVKKFFKRSFENLMNRYQHELKFISKYKRRNIYSYIIEYFLNFHLFGIPKNVDSSNKISRIMKTDMLFNTEKFCINNMKNVGNIKCHSSFENKIQNEIVIVIDNLDDLFEFAMKNCKLLIESLSIIISEMSKHLYTKPYPILFGRIKIHNSTLTQNINQSFLDGFKI